MIIYLYFIAEPVTEVVGGPDLFIDRGSTINLKCTVKFSPEPPLHIIWNHNNNVSMNIAYLISF